MTKHFVGKSLTSDNEKDLWQTPKEIFNALDQEFNFDCDICASKDNRLKGDYFSEEKSALDNEWGKYIVHKAAFMNPPYSQTQLFMERAAQQAEKHNITVVALVNANTDTKWFADAVKSSNEIRLLTGRVGFVKADGTKSNGNTKGQVLIIWRGNCKTPCNITMFDRDDFYKGANK